MKAMRQLPYHYGIKLRFYPSNDQRFYYNQLVAINRELYNLKRVKIYIQSVQERIEELRELLSHNNLKKHFIFLWDKYADSLALANTKQNYQRAWDNYKDGLQNVPNFHAKKKHPYEYTYQTNCSYPKKGNPSVRLLDKKHLHLPKLKSVRVSHVRNFLLNKTDYRIGTVTIYKDSCDRYYVSLQLGSEMPFVKPKATTHKKLGIDLNTSNFLTDNHGNEVANPRYYYRKQHDCLKRLQRSLSRRYRHNKGRNLRDCKNYQKMRRKVAQVATHVKYQRRNFLQRLSTKLIEKQDFLVVENLSSKNMLRNHRLAQSISDVGWRSFLTMLQYKGKLYDRQVILVNPKNTTQTCSNCNYIMKGENYLTLKNRQWTCPHCKQFHIRDVNAAQNILIKGLIKA